MWKKPTVLPWAILVCFFNDPVWIDFINKSFAQIDKMSTKINHQSIWYFSVWLSTHEMLIIKKMYVYINLNEKKPPLLSHMNYSYCEEYMLL